MKWTRVLILVLLVFVLSGCGKEPETIASIPTNTHPPIPTITNTVTPSITPTKTLIPTPTETLIPTRTPKPSPTPFPFPTPEDAHFYELSPNGEWVVWEIYAGMCGSNLIIQNYFDESIMWMLSYREPYYSDVIDLAVYPEHWSRDGQYLYFITDIGCADGGVAFPGFISLKRLELSTGIVTTTLPGKHNYGKISHNSRYLAYFNGSRVFVWDFKTGETKKVKVVIENELSRGDIVWSPGNTKFTFTSQFEIEGDPPTNFSYALIVVDRTKMEYKILLDDYLGYSVKWLDDETISVSLSPKILINTTTGEITEVE